MTPSQLFKMSRYAKSNYVMFLSKAINLFQFAEGKKNIYRHQSCHSGMQIAKKKKRKYNKMRNVRNIETLSIHMFLIKN